MYEADAAALGVFADMVDELQGQRIGISIFGTHHAQILPLNNDYEATKDFIKNLAKYDSSATSTYDSYPMLDRYAGAVGGMTNVLEGVVGCVQDFTKLDEKPIGNRSEISRADYSIFLDDTLFSDQALDELKPGGKILLNTKKQILNENVITIDGDSIAEKYLGLPITNTILLGALAAVSGYVPLDEMIEAVKQTMPTRLHERNIAAVRAAYEEAGK
jgi:pyruvate ferredoxin oxidoreductase gamma subunit